MLDNTGNNKRLVKNTLYLYARTLFLLIISLYTTRITLAALGIDDFGVYNVVGGIVAILTTINGAMSGASSRFFSFELGKSGNTHNLRLAFSTIQITHWGLAVIVFVLGETIGLWFVIEKIVIPEGRELASMICYQCSLIVSVFSIISVPYNAIIIGYERMDVYAYISIFDSLMRLLVVVPLILGDYDNLICYSILLIVVQIINWLCYKLYCNKSFEDTKGSILWDKDLFKQITSFTGWTFIGQLAVMGYTQGINILLNLFFGPVVNAARGIAVQVQSAARILVNNFQIAIRPQMIKTWAQGDVEYMHNLVVYSTRLSYYLTSLTVFPLILVIAPILKLWLGEVPDHTIAFVRIILYSMLADAFCHGMIVSVHATGKIRNFQIWEGFSLLTVVPIAYFLLYCFKVTPEHVMWVYFFVQVMTQFVRMYIALPQIQMSWGFYVKNVFPRILVVSLLLIAPSFHFFLPIDSPLSYTLLVFSTDLIYTCTVIYFVGLNKNERILLNLYILKTLKK